MNCVKRDDSDHQHVHVDLVIVGVESKRRETRDGWPSRALQYLTHNAASHVIKPLLKHNHHMHHPKLSSCAVWVVG